MSRKPKALEVREAVESDFIEDDDLDIDATDYGFIVGQDGTLKTFFCPDEMDGEPPKEILKIFKIFKIADIGVALTRPTTLH